MNKELEHIIYFESGEIYKSFLHSNWYDTTTPYQYCVRELTEVKNTIQSGQKLRIESFGKTHLISTSGQFRSWIENAFCGGFEEHVFKSE